MVDPLRLLIDTDPGVDDGVALTMALRHPGARVEAITVVHGNTHPQHGVRNARLASEVCEVDVPVYAGATAPLARRIPERPRWIHGEDGFGDLGLRPRRTEADAGFAPDQIVERLMREPGAITLMTLGPLTNVALALAREPRIAQAARALVLMGGATQAAGNVTPVAEFNIWADPEAAKAVFAAGFRLTMVGVELCRGPSRLTEEDLAPLAASPTAPAALVRELLGHSLRVAGRRPRLPGEHGATCPDAVAMAVALDPATLTDAADAFVDVETSGELTTGMTVVDRLGILGKPATARVGFAVDAEAFKRLLVECCR